MIRKGISIKSIGDADWTSAWKIGEDDLKKLYGFMSIASVIVRQFLLPNPFECFGEKATLINWIAEPIIQMVAYFIVGLFYIKGAAPFWGSFAYLTVYIACIGFLMLCGLFSFAWWWIIFLTVVLLGIIVGISWFLSFRNNPIT